MSPEQPTSTTKLCPTCGTRVSMDATRCLVCGTDLSGLVSVKTPRQSKVVQGSRMPEITLGLPAAIGLLALFVIVSAALIFMFVNRTNSSEAEPTTTPSVTPTETSTLTLTPEPPTATFTPEPSPTPFEYTVKLGETCLSIAISFKVNVQSIVLLNDLPADCSTLYENQKLLIPQPTPTATPPPTNTLSVAEATDAACEKFEYTVQENDTLSSISLNYAISAEAIRDYNGLVNDVVRYGQPLILPLCERNATPGPSPTPTIPPPYPAVNLLLPPDGAPFSRSGEVVTLQWASVGALRENEAYAVTVEDVTEGQGRKLVEYVSDTKFIVPDSFLPGDVTPHVIRWWVAPVRQMGTDEDGNPIWDTAGAISASRVFTWYGASAEITPTP